VHRRVITSLVGLLGVWGCGPADMDTIERQPPPFACGPALPWSAGSRYAAGSKVTAGHPVRVFQCRPWPFEGWCPMAAYQPAKIGGPWLDAWVDEGLCPKDLLRELEGPGSAERH
jgi:hypothetical protein